MHTFTHSSWLPALCSPAGARAIRLSLFMQSSLSCPSAATHSASITAPAGRNWPTGVEGKRFHARLGRHGRNGLGVDGLYKKQGEMGAYRARRGRPGSLHDGPASPVLRVNWAVVCLSGSVPSSLLANLVSEAAQN
ncbi:hypothetical protein CRENBAI_022700 [Crenichthys baileyi]|uniref:Secreted protein n=1 Tax=Crenichthys baileyi TaxID=28760 RepID=A0AAV9SQ23_9TELE